MTRPTPTYSLLYMHLTRPSLASVNTLPQLSTPHPLCVSHRNGSTPNEKYARVSAATSPSLEVVSLLGPVLLLGIPQCPPSQAEKSNPRSTSLTVRSFPQRLSSCNSKSNASTTCPCMKNTSVRLCICTDNRPRTSMYASSHNPTIPSPRPLPLPMNPRKTPDDRVVLVPRPIMLAGDQPPPAAAATASSQLA